MNRFTFLLAAAREKLAKMDKRSAMGLPTKTEPTEPTEQMIAAGMSVLVESWPFVQDAYEFDPVPDEPLIAAYKAMRALAQTESAAAQIMDVGDQNDQTGSAAPAAGPTIGPALAALGE